VKVKSVQHLCILAQSGRAVMGGGSLLKPCPAAFVVCMQAAQVQGMINRGMMVYTRPKGQKEKKT
jgi:hypothetical protein